MTGSAESAEETQQKQGTLIRPKDYNFAKLAGFCAIGLGVFGDLTHSRIGAVGAGLFLLVLGVYASRKAGDGYV